MRRTTEGPTVDRFSEAYYVINLIVPTASGITLCSLKAYDFRYSAKMFHI